MNLYEIHEQIAALVNEDGEIADIEQFEALNMARDQKIENIGLWIKNLEAEAAAIKAEEDNLKKRRVSNANKAERLRSYLSRFLDGQKFTTPRIKISYRKSEAVEIDDESAFIEWAASNRPDLIRTSVDLNKAAIKQALKAGEEIEGAYLAVRTNMQIN